MSNSNLYKFRTFVCKACQKEVTLRRAKNKTQFCSQKCYRTSPKPNRKTGDTRLCMACQAPTYKSKTFQYSKWFCSTFCHDKYQGRNKIEFKCDTCRETFRLSKSLAENRKYSVRFCSITCRNKDPKWKTATFKGNLAQLNKRGPNKLEIAGYKILDDIGAEYSKGNDILNNGGMVSETIGRAVQGIA